MVTTPRMMLLLLLVMWANAQLMMLILHSQHPALRGDRVSARGAALLVEMDMPSARHMQNVVSHTNFRDILPLNEGLARGGANSQTCLLMRRSDAEIGLIRYSAS